MSVDLKILSSKGFPVAVVRLNERMEILSSAVMNGGHVVSDTLIIAQVPKRFDHSDPQKYLEEIRKDLGLPKDAVGFLTAAEVSEIATLSENTALGVRTYAVATAGLTNKVTAGDVIDDMEERLDRSAEKDKQRKSKKAGTINIIAVSPLPLTDAAKVNASIVITESKTAAMRSLGHDGTGTTTDAIAIVSPIKGKKEMYCGTATPLGISLARSVRDSVTRSLIKRDDLPEAGTFIDQLEKMGITEERLWEAAMLLYDPNPNWETGKMKDMFRSLLKIYSKDINASSLVQAAMEMDRLGNMDMICAMPRGMFATDPIHLIADEILGMQLAQYIAGTRGIFEFHRFDRHKPGIIKELGPFMDDIICGLVGGIMSSIYTKLFDGEI